MTEPVYLVLVRCTMDDLPIGIFASMAEAGDYVQRLLGGDPQNHLLEKAVDHAAEALKMDPSEIVCVDVLKMRGGDVIQSVWEFQDIYADEPDTALEGGAA